MKGDWIGKIFQEPSGGKRESLQSLILNWLRNGKVAGGAVPCRAVGEGLKVRFLKQNPPPSPSPIGPDQLPISGLILLLPISHCMVHICKSFWNVHALLLCIFIYTYILWWSLTEQEIIHLHIIKSNIWCTLGGGGEKYEMAQSSSSK